MERDLLAIACVQAVGAGGASIVIWYRDVKDSKRMCLRWAFSRAWSGSVVNW